MKTVSVFKADLKSMIMLVLITNIIRNGNYMFIDVKVDDDLIRIKVPISTKNLDKLQIGEEHNFQVFYDKAVHDLQRTQVNGEYQIDPEKWPNEGIRVKIHGLTGLQKIVCWHSKKINYK